MKKKLLFSMIAAGSLLIAGCGKDDIKPTGAGSTTNSATTDGSGSGGGATTNGEPLSPEASKTRLENSSKEMASIMSNALNGTGIQAIINLMGLMGTDKQLANSSLPAMSFVRNTSQINNSSSMLKSMKADEEQKNDLQKAMDSVQGIYTWNKNTKKFDKEAYTGALIVRFPGIKDVEDNTAEFVFSNLTYTSVEGAFTNNLMTGCKARLDINGKTVISYMFTAGYDEKGLPESLVSRLAVDDFSLTYSYGRSSSNVAVDYSFRYKSQIIFAEGFQIAGTLTEEKALELTKYFSDSTEQKREISKVSEFISKATIYYQFMDAKVVGSVDTYNLLKTIEKSQNKEYGSAEDAVADMNKAVSLYAIFASTNERIAATEMYVNSVQRERGKYVKDPETGELVYKVETYTAQEPAMRLLFADETKADLTSYFNSTDITSLFSEMKDKTGTIGK